MFGNSFSLFLAFGARCLALAGTALAIKLMDDVLDAPRDRARGIPNWAAALGASATPYALVCLVVAASLDWRLTVATFLAAYGWGMAGSWRSPMPTGLKGWQESVLAALISWWAVGWRGTVFALALVGVIHWADDWLDRRPGAHGRGAGGTGGWAVPGLVPIAGGLFVLIGLFLDPWLYVGGLAVGGLIAWLTRPPWARGGVTPWLP